MEKPQLSDDDRRAIASHIYEYMKEDLYRNAGKGIVNLVFKIFVLSLFGLAVYGYSKGWFSL